MTQKLSIVICTYNREKYLKLALESLVDQSVDKEQFEVLVIDNNSSDATKVVSDKFKKKLPLKYFLETNQGLSYARNRGIKESKFKYIAFLDDDAKAHKDWVKVALRLIKDRKPLIFGGPIYPYYETAKPKWFKDDYEIRTHGQEAKVLRGRGYISGSNIFFDKEVFDKIGFFDPQFGMTGEKIAFGEETKLQIIADEKGIERFYHPDLFVFHLTPEWKMKVSYFFKRAWAGKVSSVKIFSSKSRAYLFFASIYEFFRGLLFLLLCPFRDKKKYPFWQNYFVERLVSDLTSLGKIKGLFLN